MGLLLAFGTGSGDFPSIWTGRRQNAASSAVWLPAWSMQAGPQGNFVRAAGSRFDCPPHVGWSGHFTICGSHCHLDFADFLRLAGGKHVAHTVHTDDGQTLKQAVANIANRSYILLHLVSLPAVSTSPFWLPTCQPKFHFAASLATVASDLHCHYWFGKHRWLYFSGWCTGRFWQIRPLRFICFRVAMILIYLAAPKTDLNFLSFRRRTRFHLAGNRRPSPPEPLPANFSVPRYLATLWLTMLSHQIGGFWVSYIGGIVITRFNDYDWIGTPTQSWQARPPCWNY